MLASGDVLTSGGLYPRRPVEYPPTTQMIVNEASLIDKVNQVYAAFGQDRKPTSGYRPAVINVSLGGVRGDAHETCEAVDVEDGDCELADWLTQNWTFVKSLGLFVEHFCWTHSPTDVEKRWIHVQTRAVHSGAVMFVPNSDPPLWVGRWSDAAVFA